MRRFLQRVEARALLSQRLKELEASGVIERAPSQREAGAFDYRLTADGRELAPLVEGFWVWGQRWVDSELSLQRLDAQLLMWDMRRRLGPSPMPDRRSVIQFRYPELPTDRRSWWLLVEPGQSVDLCSLDPGFDVDLYVSSDLRTMTAIWMGLDTVSGAIAENRLILTGDAGITRNVEHWLRLSPFAKHARAPAAKSLGGSPILL